ncbi:TPA: hypothetical protein SMT99_002368 [Proteus mirabilis]|nr:hypothetical protein [Proteus mirabilis]
MTILHSTAIPNLPKPDMHTGVMLPMFLFRFWTKTECPEKKELWLPALNKLKNYSVAMLFSLHSFLARLNYGSRTQLRGCCKKSDQLNALLFQLNNLQIPESPDVETLIELAHELSGDVVNWILEENAQRDNDHDKKNN